MKLNIVPARTGFLWFRLGIQTFLRQPLALTGLFFMYMAAASLLSLLPIVGGFAALTIVPAATLGFMAATQEAGEGRFPTPKVLVSAFRTSRSQMRAMLVLGVIYAACFLAVVELVPMAMGLSQEEQVLNPENLQNPRLQAAMLVVSLLYLPLSLMFWHAPALVHWHGVAPVKSLFFSTVACIRNGRAFLLYGLAWAALVLLVSMVAMIVSLLVGNPGLAGPAMMPLGLLIAAMFTTSLYFTFRDSFTATDEAAPQPTTQDAP